MSVTFFEPVFFRSKPIISYRILHHFQLRPDKLCNFAGCPWEHLPQVDILIVRQFFFQGSHKNILDLRCQVDFTNPVGNCLLNLVMGNA